MKVSVAMTYQTESLTEALKVRLMEVMKAKMTVRDSVRLKEAMTALNWVDRKEHPMELLKGYC